MLTKNKTKNLLVINKIKNKLLNLIKVVFFSFLVLTVCAGAKIFLYLYLTCASEGAGGDHTAFTQN